MIFVLHIKGGPEKDIAVHFQKHPTPAELQKRLEDKHLVPAGLNVYVKVLPSLPVCYIRVVPEARMLPWHAMLRDATGAYSIQLAAHTPPASPDRTGPHPAGGSATVELDR